MTRHFGAQTIDGLPLGWERNIAENSLKLGCHVDTGPEGIAIFSPCSLYRYLLSRQWDRVSPPRIAVWIMCNPSTADAFVLDPTIRRCVTFSKREGCTALIVVNVYAYRSTQPDALHDVENAFGAHNHVHIRQAMRVADVAIAAWGAFRAKRTINAHHTVKEIAREVGKPLHALRRTKDGDPGHPLYVPANAPLVAMHEPAVYFTTEAV